MSGGASLTPTPVWRGKRWRWMAGRWVRASAFDTRRRSVLDMAMGLTPSCFLGMPMRMAEER